MGTSLFFATPRTKDVEPRPCPTNTHTYTLYSSSFHGRLSPQISFCDPHPTVFFLSFSFFLRMQTGFEAKAAFDPSRFVNLPMNLSASTSNFTITLKKIYTDIPLELPKDDQVLLLQGFDDVLSPKRDDGKRFFSTSENLKNGWPDQKSRCRTCAQACYRPFKCLLLTTYKNVNFSKMLETLIFQRSYAQYYIKYTSHKLFPLVYEPINMVSVRVSLNLKFPSRNNGGQRKWLRTGVD